MTTERFDAIIVGAGMAGASLAYELAPHMRVVVLERESAPGYHATGRSAALFSEIYGPPPVRALSRASRAFLETPPAGFAAAPLIIPRGCLFPADSVSLDALDRLEAEEGAAVRRLSGDAARQLAPILKPEACRGALLEPDSHDIDVDGLHQGFLRGLRGAGGVVTNAGVDRVERSGGVWRIETAGRAFEAPMLIDAAGAWADVVATAAGVRPLGLSPRRRTVILVDRPPMEDFVAWPCVIDAAEAYYFKPDAGRLLISPADEIPTEPCDAQPEELDVAIAVDRFEQVTDWPVRRVLHRWAGLRTFAADRLPAIGWDHEAEGFFWLAGQGGYGIQTAPAAARLAAALIRGEAIPDAVLAERVDPDAYAPGRLRDPNAIESRN